jgi:AcrR family transcriptional regulator
MNRKPDSRAKESPIRRRADPRPRSRGDQASSNATRASILDAAARLIADEGYNACTMRNVADRVQIQAGSLYYHFSSKDEIIEEIMNSGIVLLLDKVQRELAELPPDASFAEQLKVAISTHISCMLSEGTAFLHVYEYVPPVLKRRSRAMREKYASLWVRIFEQGIAAGDVNADVDLSILIPYLLGGINRIPEWFRRNKFAMSDVVAMATDTLLHGIMKVHVIA